MGVATDSKGPNERWDTWCKEHASAPTWAGWCWLTLTLLLVVLVVLAGAYLLALGLRLLLLVIVEAYLLIYGGY